MRQSARFHRDRPALVAGTRTLTFGQAWERGVRVANGLRALGVRPGDRVASVEDNDLGAADLFLGAAIAGAVRVPLYARNARRAHQQMIEQTQTRVLVVDATHADEVKGLDDPTDGAAGLEHLLVRDEGYEEWLAAQSAVDPEIRVEA